MSNEKLETETTPAAKALPSSTGSQELFNLAFALGFMVSREGYNGECAFDHLAPHELETYYGGLRENADAISSYVEIAQSWDEFTKLQQEAWEYANTK